MKIWMKLMNYFFEVDYVSVHHEYSDNIYRIKKFPTGIKYIRVGSKNYIFTKDMKLTDQDGNDNYIYYPLTWEKRR